jgi:hypothetical protein
VALPLWLRAHLILRQPPNAADRRFVQDYVCLNRLSSPRDSATTGSVLWLFGLALLLALMACTPEYNWREIKNVEDGFKVMLPAKPVFASREINLDGVKVTMKVAVAQVNETVFLVGIVTLPVDNDSQRASALAAMRAQMLRNLSANETRSTVEQVAVANLDGNSLSYMPAIQIQAHGVAKPSNLVGGFVARGVRAYQYLVLGDAIDAESARYFTDSFRLLIP